MVPEAVLFDLDETLVTGPDDADERLRQAFAAVGRSPFFSPADVRRWVGRVEGADPTDLRVKAFRGAAREAATSDERDPENDDDTAAAAARDDDTAAESGDARDGDAPVDPDRAATVGERVARAYEPAGPTEYEPLPGARAAVETVRERGFAVGLVTNGAREPQRAKLREAGLADAFDATFFATPERGIKPDPRPFTTTADALGVAPSDCVSVGDGYETDVVPAADLGMTTVWVGDGDAPEADYVIAGPSAVPTVPVLR